MTEADIEETAALCRAAVRQGYPAPRVLGGPAGWLMLRTPGQAGRRGFMLRHTMRHAMITGRRGAWHWHVRLFLRDEERTQARDFDGGATTLRAALRAAGDCPAPWPP